MDKEILCVVVIFVGILIAVSVPAIFEAVWDAKYDRDMAIIRWVGKNVVFRYDGLYFKGKVVSVDEKKKLVVIKPSDTERIIVVKARNVWELHSEEKDG